MLTVLLKTHLYMIAQMSGQRLQSLKSEWTRWWVPASTGRVCHINRELRNSGYETHVCHQQICDICPFVRNSVSSPIQWECQCTRMSAIIFHECYLYAQSLWFGSYTLQRNAAFYRPCRAYLLSIENLLLYWLWILHKGLRLENHTL